MNKRWLAGLLGAAAFWAFPSTSSAQSYPPGYSPIDYLRSGTYYEPHPGSYSPPSNYTYGSDYDPYNYLKHGSYSSSPYNSSTSTTGSFRPFGDPPRIYGGEYDPFYYFRHGSYAEPRYGINSGPVYRTYSPVTAEAQVEPPAANRASIQVRVPGNAEIWFEGDKTIQTGSVRQFVSPELQPGKKFTYDIRARWTDGNGKVIDLTKQVKVQAGQRSVADFSQQ